MCGIVPFNEQNKFPCVFPISTQDIFYLGDMKEMFEIRIWKSYIFSNVFMKWFITLWFIIILDSHTILLFQLSEQYILQLPFEHVPSNANSFLPF